jgi:hypothetical protein
MCNDDRSHAMSSIGHHCYVYGWTLWQRMDLQYHNSCFIYQTFDNVLKEMTKEIWMFWMVLNLKKSQMKQISNKSPITKNASKEWGWHSTPQLICVVPFNNIIDKKN